MTSQGTVAAGQVASRRPASRSATDIPSAGSGQVLALRGHGLEARGTPVIQVTSRNLKQSVAPIKRREQNAHGGGGTVELRHDGDRGDTQVTAIDIIDQGYEEEERDNPPSVSGRGPYKPLIRSPYCLDFRTSASC